MRIVTVGIIVLIILLFFPSIGQAKPEISGQNAILMEQSTGRVLFEKNAHDPESIASITKIMTAIIAIESGKMQEKAKTSRKAIYTEGSSIYLEQGEKMTINDLVYGLMLRSGNDAAVAISEHIGGSEEGFVYLMNEKAKWLGMNHTHFDNPHGLDSDSHYSSAYDMAILMSYAMKNKTFRKITGAQSYLSENRTYSWQNKNKLLTQYYDYCTGGKTGYTKKTGRTLVSSAEKDGMSLIAVTLDAPDDWRDHIQMFEWGFTNYDMEKIAEEKSISFKLNESSKVMSGYMQDDIAYPLTDKEKAKVTNQLYIVKDASEITSERIGKNVFYLDGKEIAETDVLRNEQKLEQRKTIFESFISLLQQVVGVGVKW
ncbi:D-alanyl-D-alanine carboxypeptidase [Virgibacillus sp. AGTR]|uniref:D-alanyl-D-alanine carboxypeptidase n=1 Tax=Virgibacillus salarius TaxID=447199 RepID=A0A941IAM4_9BACI|nr:MULTISPECIES: D-alanyl-D-alanine carboxypeptidase family protein [Bacillaceae]NAZ08225.1 D-alanyl-D-alanine carboxypeptidase [Agaribacter marinus]MBR7795512.1 D-alanyl-D-alanine carboxypeptidase [Virgibacillus salarius]MCC2249119.1 D-alanyl-D-alanine carboxypeptidase [Virgibacillus sp. AGTR]MDY7043422.1 D-alanyl-D-alanine carboxypeptidase family protein [Virgibacillus sp. M23]QRZ16974.1 D-alanyl-D-alanine carboxypeptidase [Virgibacillus sp. AGTR]